MPEKFSASNATKFIHCHASANLDIAIDGWTPPERDPDANNAANRGTRMHTIFAGIMSLPLSDMERMVDAVRYVAAIRSQRRYKVLIEQTEVADWLPSTPKTTADLVLYLKDELHIFDLKTGKIPVEAVDNDQMLYYAATYLRYAPDAKFVTLHIVQPWANQASAWIVTLSELYIWMAKAINHDVEITDGDTTFMPGDHCKFCPANPYSRAAKGKPLCPAMMQVLYPLELLDRAAIFEEDEKE